MRPRSRPMSARAARRAAERADPPGDGPLPVEVRAIPGEYDQGAHGQLPPKQPGRHRWVLTCAYSVTDAQVANERDNGGEISFLDHESRVAMTLGCWDCEQPYPNVHPGTRCPA